MSDVPPSSAPIQQEACQTTKPVSESLTFAMGGGINYALINCAKVGDIVASDLDEATFQGLRDTTWVLSDGRSVVGSVYQSLTGRSNIPDRRGDFLRGKDHGRGVDPHGDLAVGTEVANQTGPTSSSWGGIGVTGITPPAGSTGVSFDAVDGHTESFTSPIPNNTNLGAGSETNPRYSVVNYFVKINP